VKEIGQVEHVVLTTHAYEHKLFVAPFARKFPGCQVRRVRALQSDWLPALSFLSSCQLCRDAPKCESIWRRLLRAGVDEPRAVELPRQPAGAGEPLPLITLSSQQQVLTVIGIL
jgi:Domain of unknown function (DUF4336)